MAHFCFDCHSTAIILFLIIHQLYSSANCVPLPVEANTNDLVELIRIANGGGAEFENFDKRRNNRELFGKRSVEVGYDRYSRRSHELFGKRTDAEMAQHEDEAEHAQRLDENDNTRSDGAAMKFLIISGYPAHFPDSKRLVQKLREKAALRNTEEEQPKVVLKRRNRELFGKRSSIMAADFLPDYENEEEAMSESQLSALLSSLLAANKHQQPRQRRARSGELFG